MLVIKYIDTYADVSSNDNNKFDSEEDQNNEVCMSDFITIQRQKIIRRIITEEDAFSESDIEAFLDKNTEARNYCICSKNEEEVVFSETEKNT